MERGKWSIFLTAPVNCSLEFQLHFCKTSEPACINPQPPAAREGPPYPVLDILHRNAIVTGGFPNPNSKTLDSPGAKRSFPVEMVPATAGGEAVPGLRPAELHSTGHRTLPIAQDVLKADNDHL